MFKVRLLGGFADTRTYNEGRGPMLDRVAGTLSRYNMLRPGDRVGVAVSGGADSVCLLHVLNALAPALNVSLTVLHLNHKLRGAESDQDAEFVGRLARDLGLGFVGDTVNVALIEDNLEQAGRNSRQSFFRRLIEPGVVNRVATGHTRSDQAETVLYRLIRGSGTAGLAGIAPVTHDGIVRPLIACDRDDVLRFLNDRKLPWREDRTNTDIHFVRNRIRHTLLPLLSSVYNPRIAATLADVAVIAADEEDHWFDEVTKVRLQHIRAAADALIIGLSELQAVHVAIRRRLIRQVISEVKGDLRGIDTSHIESILRLAEQPEGDGRIQLPGVDVWRSFDWLRFALQCRADPADYTIDLDLPADLTVPGSGLVLRVDLIESSGTKNDYNSYNEISFLDFDRLDGPFAVRNWRPGDRYSRPGGEEKIKQLFQRARIPAWERRSWPVLTSGGRVVWARQFGAAEDVAPDASTRRLLRIQGVCSPSFHVNRTDR